MAVGSLDIATLRREIERLAGQDSLGDDPRELVEALLVALENGSVRAAVPEDGRWVVQPTTSV